jgi:hypothetical protein
MSLFDDFDVDVEDNVLPGENADDLRRAVEIIAGERARANKRKKPTKEDALVALCAMCFPIPLCPPKAEAFTVAVRQLRRSILSGLATDERLQEIFVAGLSEEIKRNSAREIRLERFEDIFRIEMAGEG